MPSAVRMITVDVAVAAEDMAAEEMVMNTKGAPKGEAKKTTRARWTKLPQMAMATKRTRMRLCLIKVTTPTPITEPHRDAAEGLDLALAEAPTGVDNSYQKEVFQRVVSSILLNSYMGLGTKRVHREKRDKTGDFNAIKASTQCVARIDT